MRRKPFVSAVVLAFSWSLTACDPPPKNLPDVAKRVHAKADWMADSKECPDKFVPQQKLSGVEAGKHCDGDRAGSCYAECEAGDVRSCYWLAYSLQLSKVDEDAAQALYQRSCKLGSPSGCTNRAASVLQAGLTDSAAHTCAANTFAKTCAVEDAWGCSMYALALHRGLGGVKDDKAALQAIQNACAIGGGPRDPACASATSLRQQIEGGASP